MAYPVVAQLGAQSRPLCGPACAQPASGLRSAGSGESASPCQLAWRSRQQRRRRAGQRCWVTGSRPALAGAPRQPAAPGSPGPCAGASPGPPALPGGHQPRSAQGVRPAVHAGCELAVLVRRTSERAAAYCCSAPCRRGWFGWDACELSDTVHRTRHRLASGNTCTAAAQHAKLAEWGGPAWTARTADLQAPRQVAVRRGQQLRGDHEQRLRWRAQEQRAGLAVPVRGGLQLQGVPDAGACGPHSSHRLAAAGALPLAGPHPGGAPGLPSSTAPPQPPGPGRRQWGSRQLRP